MLKLRSLSIGLWAVCLLVAGGHLLPARASATVVYEFLGITAAVPPTPNLPSGVPPHFEAFTLRTPTFLSNLLGSSGRPTNFKPDSCLNCLFGPDLGLSADTASIQFNDALNIGYSYFFLPDAFSTLGSHTTAQYDAVNGPLGPFENTGTLFVTLLVTAVPVPGPSSLLVMIFGVAVLVGFGVKSW
jgi:hypothetical protein